MDPVSAFGVVTGSLQVVQFIGQNIAALASIRGKYKNADVTIRSLIGELSTIKSAITQLHDWATYNAESSSSHREYDQSFDAALEGCTVVMEALSDEVARLTPSATGNDHAVLGFMARVKLVWNDEVMNGLQDQLGTQIQALNLLLQACHCRSATEQLELLRKFESRQIFQKVADDTATLRSRIGSTAGSQADTYSVSNRVSLTDFEFDDVIVSSAAYRQALHHSQLRSEANATAALERGPSKRTMATTSDEGYASNTGIFTPTRSLSTNSSTGTGQGLYRALRPNDSVVPEPTRSKSVSFGSHPAHHYDPNIRRSHSTNTASPVPSLPGSRRDKIVSVLRRFNTSSRVNLTTPSSRNLVASPTVSSSTRGRKDRDRDLTTSIDLTSPDGVNAPLIVKAAQSGSRFDVERLVESGHDIEARHLHSLRNALMVAAHCGKDDIVDLLILNNARLTTLDASGSTALHLAASRGHLAVMELLLMEGLDVDIKTSHGRTALWIAANKGQVEATQMLLASRAKVNTRADNQMTALHIAAQQGDFEIVSLLTSHGADVDARDAAMMTALHHACQGGHLDVIELLLNQKANIDAPGSERRTPLICAAANGQLFAVQLLLKRRATFKCLDEGGMTALHWAAFNGHVEIVDLLSQKRGALNMANIQGRTALHLAIMNAQFAVVEFLMRRNPALDLRCQSGLNPLHYACVADSSEIVRLLLMSGADIEAQTENTQQQKPIHIAAAGRSVHLLGLLCERGASLESRDATGDRALCVACRHGHVAAVQKLLDFGSPLHLRFRARSLEDSPLCLAAMGGHSAVVSLLISYGASVLSKDEFGWSPIRYAAYHGHPEVLEALLASNPSAANVDNQFSPDTFGLSADKIGFAADPNISKDRKRRVLDILGRAQRSSSDRTDSPFSPSPAPSSVNNTALSAMHSLSSSSAPSSVNNTAMHSLSSSSAYQSYSTAPSYPMSSFATPPQELPGTLEQGLPSSRSTTPVQMRRNRHNPSPDDESENHIHARTLSGALRVLPALHEHHVDGQAVPADELMETLRNLRLPEQPADGTPPDNTTIDHFQSESQNYTTANHRHIAGIPGVADAVEASTFSPFMTPRYITPQAAVLPISSPSSPPAVFSPQPIAPVTQHSSLAESGEGNPAAASDGGESIPSAPSTTVGG